MKPFSMERSHFQEPIEIKWIILKLILRNLPNRSRLNQSIIIFTLHYPTVLIKREKILCSRHDVKPYITWWRHTVKVCHLVPTSTVSLPSWNYDATPGNIQYIFDGGWPYDGEKHSEIDFEIRRTRFLFFYEPCLLCLLTSHSTK